jgi:hypothetical protein
MSLAQPWSADGICDFTDGVQWNNGGAKGCACTWYTVSGTDTILNCAFGDCGQNALFECVYDCNGHNGFATNSIPRQCDATASPICWFNGAGSAGQLFCEGLALPIELYEFGGVSVDGNNELYWITASELDNDYFTVSHSHGSEAFEVIGTIDGAGTTVEEQNYRFIHVSPPRGVNYYRLTQVDYNGDSKEYYIISIKNIKDTSGDLFSKIYPNPSDDMFYFNYNGNKTNIPIEVSIVDNMGNVVLDGIVESFNNTQGISFKMDTVDKGIYQVILKQGETVEIKKVTVI